MSQSPRDQFDRYLDRLLGPEEEARIQRAAQSDPELKREAELQRWIDNELDDLFAYDSSRAPVIPHPPAPPASEPPASIPIVTRRNFFKPLAIAAAFILAGVAVWIAVTQLGPSPAKVQYVAADVVYNKLIGAGFTPDFICTTDEEFKQAVKKQFGSPLVLAQSPGVTALGWAYNAGFRGKIVGDRTMMLLMKVDDKNILVLMDTTDRPKDHPIDIPPGQGLHVFRKQVGPIFNYEVTPLDRPRVIDNLREP